MLTVVETPNVQQKQNQQRTPVMYHKAALPYVCAATTIPPYCVKYFFDNIGISTDTPE